MAIKFDKSKDSDIKSAVLLRKPSGTVAIVGNLSSIQKKFYNRFLFNAQEIFKKDLKKDWLTIDLRELKKSLNRNDKKLGKDNERLKNEIYEMIKIFVQYNYFEKDKIIEGRTTILNDIQFDTYSSGMIYVRYNIPAVVKKSMIARMNGDKNALFANIDLKVIKGIIRKHTITLYEICKDYQNVQVPKMTIKDFKEIFGIKGMYKLITDLRRWVLDPACKELNTNPNVNFEVSYKLIKQGWKYSHIKFNIRMRKKQKQLYANEFAKQKAELLLSLIPSEYRSLSTEKILNKYKAKGVEYLKAQVKYVDNANPREYTVYLKQAIESDWAGVEKSQIAEEIEKRERIAAEVKKKEATRQKRKKEEEEIAKNKKILDRWEEMTEKERFQAVMQVAESNSWVKGKLEKGTWEEDDLIPITVMIQREKNLEKTK